MTEQALVAGSLAAVTKKNSQSLAEGFMNVKAFVMVDVSYSMSDRDATGGRSRYGVACDELAQLQSANPGEIGVGAFSDNAQFCPGGVPVFQKGGTSYAAALRMMKMADGCGIRLILISDGEPQDGNEAMKLARTFRSKIDTIYVGRETGSGRAFLADLSAATGGISIVNETSKLNLLSENVGRLIAA